MQVKNRLIAATASILAFLLVAPAAAASLNGSIKIGEGETSDGASSVNGSITVGANAVVSGDVGTVNGTIRVDQGAKIRDAETVNGSLKIDDKVQSEDLSTVNGSIRVGKEAVVEGEISTVNGKISVDTGSKVTRDVSTVNGGVLLSGSEVGGTLTSVNGDVTLEDQAVLRGNLKIEKPGGWNSNKRKPKITIGPGSRVEGLIVLEREVDLYISETAEVGGVEGVMTMADAVRFSGSRP